MAGPDDEKPILDVWAREQEKTAWLRWVTENGGDADPTDRMEAVGDADPISSTALGLKNLRRVMDMLIPATSQQNWRDLEYLYKRVLGQWTNCVSTGLFLFLLNAASCSRRARFSTAMA